MSLVKTKAIQMGFDATPSNNFLIYQPLTPDGTFRIANGNQGSTTDIMTVTSAGSVTFAGTTTFSSLNFGAGLVTSPSLFPTGDTNTGIYFPTADAIALTAGGVEKLRADANGVGIGYPVRSIYAKTPKFAIESSNEHVTSAIIRNSADAVGPYIVLGKTRGTSNGAFTAPLSGDDFGQIRWAAADGTDMDGTAAFIAAQASQDVANNNTPGNLIFGTTNAGNSTATIKMSLLSSGDLGLGLNVSPSVYSGYTTFTINNGTNGSVIDLKQNGTLYGELLGLSGEFRVAATGATTPLTMYTNNIERLRINYDGNVGIGTGATAPAVKLDVQRDDTTSYTTTTDQRAKAHVVARNASESSGYFSSVSLVTGAGNQAEWSINNVWSSNYSGYLSFKSRIGGTTWAERLRIDTNGHLLPGADVSYNLGSASNRWANIYTGDLHLSNETKGGNDIDGTTGNWTLQEGEDALYIINNRNGKKYRFALEEIK